MLSSGLVSILEGSGQAAGRGPPNCSAGPNSFVTRTPETSVSGVFVWYRLGYSRYETPVT